LNGIERHERCLEARKGAERAVGAKVDALKNLNVSGTSPQVVEDARGEVARAKEVLAVAKRENSDMHKREGLHRVNRRVHKACTRDVADGDEAGLCV
jgi:hypothetical protein